MYNSIMDKERFEFYTKWFKTLLIEEFLNLSLDYQKKFIVMINKFVKDCQRIHKEAINIKERSIKVYIKDISKDLIIKGQVEKTGDNIEMSYPSFLKKPSIGDIINCTVYSMDGEVWYSSKKELIEL
jgi:hypothetical protein